MVRGNPDSPRVEVSRKMEVSNEKKTGYEIPPRYKGLIGIIYDWVEIAYIRNITTI